MWLINANLKKEIECFGLDPEFVRVIEPEQEIEALLPISDEMSNHDLAWYNINDNG